MIDSNERSTGRLPVLKAGLMAAAVIFLSSPSHLADPLIAEESPLRRLLLKNYARFEVQLLAVFYWLLNQPFMKNRWLRKSFYYGAAKFAAQRMVAGQVKTLGEMEEFIAALPEDSRIAVGPCRCRLASHACDCPLETDMYILTGTQIWLDLFPKDYRVIDRDEATAIVRNSYEQGLVPMVDRHMYFGGNTNYFVICNCCGCSCVPIIGYRVFKYDGHHLIPSTYRSVTFDELCQGDGACVDVCAFHERVVVAGKSRVIDCQGCGQCVRVCPHGAAGMVKR